MAAQREGRAQGGDAEPRRHGDSLPRSGCPAACSGLKDWMEAWATDGCDAARARAGRADPGSPAWRGPAAGSRAAGTGSARCARWRARRRRQATVGGDARHRRSRGHRACGHRRGRDPRGAGARKAGGLDTSRGHSGSDAVWRRDGNGLAGMAGAAGCCTRSGARGPAAYRWVQGLEGRVVEHGADPCVRRPWRPQGFAGLLSRLPGLRSARVPASIMMSGIEHHRCGW
jgi:hypothetical protein